MSSPTTETKTEPKADPKASFSGEFDPVGVAQSSLKKQFGENARSARDIQAKLFRDNLQDFQKTNPDLVHGPGGIVINNENRWAQKKAELCADVEGGKPQAEVLKDAGLNPETQLNCSAPKPAAP